MKNFWKKELHEMKAFAKAYKSLFESLTNNSKKNYYTRRLENYENDICKKIFACLFSVHNTIILLHHEQVCLIRLRFERYLSHGRSTSRNVA